MKILSKKTSIQCRYKSLEIPNFIIVFAYIILSFATYAIFLKKHYSIDSYTNFPTLGTETILAAGRFGFYFINVLFNALHFNLVEHQSIFTFLFIFTIAILSSSLFLRLAQKSNTDHLPSLLSLFFGVSILLLNVYILEWFLFPEVALIYTISLIFAYAAGVQISKKQTPFSFFLATFFLFSSMLFYQGSLAFFITTAFLLNLFSWIQESSEKKKFYDVLLPVGVGIVSTLLAFGSNQLFHLLSQKAAGDRVQIGGISEILSFFLQILQNQSTIFFNASGFLPPFTLIIFLFALFIILILSNNKEKQNKNLLFFALMILAIWGATFFSHLFLGVIWLTPRTITGVFCLIGFIFLTIAHWCQEALFQKILAPLGICFVCLNIFQIQVIGINHYKSNQLDKEYALLIQEEIENYEQSTGITITKIAPIQDMSPLQGYPGIRYSLYDVNMRAYFVSWANVEALNYYTGESYEKIPWSNSEVPFSNWDSFVPEEQLIFNGDTLYWVVY